MPWTSLRSIILSVSGSSLSMRMLRVWPRSAWHACATGQDSQMAMARSSAAALSLRGSVSGYHWSARRPASSGVLALPTSATHAARSLQSATGASGDGVVQAHRPAGVAHGGVPVLVGRRVEADRKRQVIGFPRRADRVCVGPVLTDAAASHAFEVSHGQGLDVDQVVVPRREVALRAQQVRQGLRVEVRDSSDEVCAEGEGHDFPRRVVVAQHRAARWYRILAGQLPSGRMAVPVAAYPQPGRVRVAQVQGHEEVVIVLPAGLFTPDERDLPDTAAGL